MLAPEQLTPAEGGVALVVLAVILVCEWLRGDR